MSVDMRDQLRDYGEFWTDTLALWEADEIIARAGGEITTAAAPRMRRSFVRRPWVAGLAAAAATLVVIGGAALMFRSMGDTPAPVTDQPAVQTPGLPEQQPPVTEAPGDVQPGVTATAPVTTEALEPAPPATTTSPHVGVVSLDPAATERDWGQPELAFDAEGRPQILYLKTWNSVGLVVCEDVACSSFSSHEVFSPERLGKYVGVPRPGAGPLIWSGGGGDGPSGDGYATQLTACSDEDCVESTTLELSTVGSKDPVIVTDESGRATVVSTGESFSAWLLPCVEPSCAEATNRLVWQAPAGFWGGPSSVALRDGLPVIALRTADGFRIGGCAEPDCLTGIEFGATVPVADMVRDPIMAIGPSGSPIAIVFTGPGDDSPTWFENVWVAACIDAVCRDAIISAVARVEDMYSEWSVATGPDGRIRFAWTEDDFLKLATCHDSTCSEISIADTGHPADDVSLAFGPDGRPVLATTSQDHDRGLEIVFCRDDSCQVGD